MIIPLDTKQLPATCFVFKNSTRCPVSFAAADIVRASSDSAKAPIYWIDVIEQRDLSNWVAETFRVQHQSPQLLFIENNAVKNNWTHRAIVSECFR